MNYTQSGIYHGSGDSSVRAYIFYDNQNTGYYVDPNSTSNVYRISEYQAPKYATTDYADAFRNTPTSSRAWHGDVAGGGPKGTWWFYDSMRHSNGSSYWGTQIAYGWEDNANELYQRNITGNSFSGWVKYWNSGHQLQSTIFYDANDTGRYLDPNGTSYLGTIYCGDVYNHLGGWFRNYGATGIYNQSYGTHFYSNGGASWGITGSGGGVELQFRANHQSTVHGYVYATPGSEFGLLNSTGNWAVRLEAGNNNMELYRVTYLNDARAYIYYDRNDTSYYDDLNAAYGTNNNGLTSRAKMRAGLTYKYNTARNDYTSDSNYWVGSMGWGTTDFNTMLDWGCGFTDSWSNPGNQPSGTSHWNSVNVIGHYTNGSNRYGWQLTMGAGAPDLFYVRGVWGGGPTSWYKMALYENNSNAARAFYASIYYDADNTGYYCNPAGSTPFNFLANGRVTLNADDSGYHVINPEGIGQNIRLGAAWSRPGVYNGSYLMLGSESYIEFVTQNVQRAYVDSSNNLISNGSVRGTIFYDTNNTSYYCDPTGYSQMSSGEFNAWARAARYEMTGVGGDSGQGNHAYAIYQVGGGWGYPYPDLGIAYHTGIRIGAYYGYNGTRFYNNHDWGTQIGSFGDGDNNLRSYYDIIAYASDRRLKENIRPIENAVAKVRSITGMVFDWKDMVRDLGFEPNAKTEVGVFAQDVEAVLPEAVTVAPFDYDWKKPGQSISGERYLTVKYEKLVPLLIQAIKEQQDQIDELRDLIKGLTNAKI
jgi:hypothetical protein